MIKNLLTLVLLLVAIQVNAQVSTLLSSKGFFDYTPRTDTALSITSTSATISGSNIKTKSNKNDTSATKYAPQNWMVLVGIDSTQGTSKNFAGLTPETEYSYYHSIIVRANDGDLDYYKGNTKTFTTEAALTMYAGNYVITSEDKYWSTSEGKLITIE